ncbi:hypothetical protein [Campylobacter sp. 2457A]|uniref:hypothetical protein n=1 Tax=Campylobacter sp. 2457A TaxID=2735784 RepID=UPI00301B9885|nr:hypothetical protein [Campylobacter sp. 2457A]
MLSVILFLIVGFVSFILIGVFRVLLLRVLLLAFVLIVFFINKRYGFLNFTGILFLLVVIAWLIKQYKNKL